MCQEHETCSRSRGRLPETEDGCQKQETVARIRGQVQESRDGRVPGTGDVGQEQKGARTRTREKEHMT